MITNPATRADLSAGVFDALPFPAFVVDADMRVLAANPRAAMLLAAPPESVLRQRGGEALHCVNSTDGCGQSAACGECVLRTSVMFALTQGQPVRRPARFEQTVNGHVEDLQALVTAAPVHHGNARAVLLCLEDLALLFAQADVLPVCLGCRKVLNEDLWQQVEGYRESQPDQEPDLGLCEECLSRLQRSGE